MGRGIERVVRGHHFDGFRAQFLEVNHLPEIPHTARVEILNNTLEGGVGHRLHPIQQWRGRSPHRSDCPCTNLRRAAVAGQIHDGPHAVGESGQRRQGSEFIRRRTAELVIELQQLGRLLKWECDDDAGDRTHLMQTETT
jgi:hypothetical protein